MFIMHLYCRCSAIYEEIMMNNSTRLIRYLSDKNISYQAIEHFHSNSSIGTAVSANVALNQIAKAVLLSDHEDRKLMAILPANNRISLAALNEHLHASYRLVKESEVYQIFADCDLGAIPPAPEAYNMNMVCDEELDKLDSVYLEAGDHETLLRIDKQGFKSMMKSGKHLHFSHQVFH